MKKLGIASTAALALVLSALPAQAQPVRASNTVWAMNTLPAGSFVTSAKAKKVSHLSDTGTVLGAAGLAVGTAALIVAATKKNHFRVPPPTVIICASPGGSCQTVQ